MPKKTHIPAEKQAELERLQYAVKRAEDKGNFDTVHHTMLYRLQAELGLITSRKIEEPTDEVNDGQ